MPRTLSGKDPHWIDVSPLGDSALIVRLRETFQDESEESINEVLSALHRLHRANIPGLIELAPAYTSIGVFFDPSQIAEGGIETFTEKIRETLAHRSRLRRDKAEARSIDVPVCFDLEFAVDLAEVAARAQSPANEVVDLYCGADYRVACLGFTPGFPYLVGLPEKLATPRRETPRKEIPAGSVAIGGQQTGIYPVPSPGGWNVIGRTPLRLFDAEKNPPALLHAGDRVRFRAITRDEFERSTA